MHAATFQLPLHPLLGKLFSNYTERKASKLSEFVSPYFPGIRLLQNILFVRRRIYGRWRLGKTGIQEHTINGLVTDDSSEIILQQPINDGYIKKHQRMLRHYSLLLRQAYRKDGKEEIVKYSK